MRYFTIMQGLRGCYMPDSSFTIAVKTRRELKNALENEAYYLRDAGFIGASKRAIAWLAAAAWRTDRKEWRSNVVPLAPSHVHGNYCYALEVCNATRQEYKEQEQ